MNKEWKKPELIELDITQTADGVDDFFSQFKKWLEQNGITVTFGGCGNGVHILFEHSVSHGSDPAPVVSPSVNDVSGVISFGGTMQNPFGF